MKTNIIGWFAIGLIVAGCSQTATQTTSAGPNGGDVVSIQNGTTYAELLTNADTGEVMVHTWDKELKNRRPVEKEPIIVGSGENRVELIPHPMDTDPPGKCSRFYGRADWVRDGNARHGWLVMHGTDGQKHSFDWQACWQGGRAHGLMWEEMGEHRRMGPGHGDGHPGGPGGRR